METINKVEIQPEEEAERDQRTVYLLRIARALEGIQNSLEGRCEKEKDL